jgi:hypothetical protein
MLLDHVYASTHTVRTGHQTGEHDLEALEIIKMILLYQSVDIHTLIFFQFKVI